MSVFVLFETNVYIGRRMEQYPARKQGKDSKSLHEVMFWIYISLNL
jgi:hypothetical protein